MRIAAQRMSFMIAQSQTKKRLRERDFDIVIGGKLHGPDVDRARWEAMSIRQEIAEDAAGRG